MASPTVEVIVFYNISTGLPMTGLTPTFDTYKDSSGSNVSQPSITEIGGGFYKFTVSFPDPAKGIVYVVNGGVGSSPRRQDRYVRPEDHDTDFVSSPREEFFGSWQIALTGPDANRMIFTKTDGVTIAAKFNLFNALGEPTGTDVYRRALLFEYGGPMGNGYAYAAEPALTIAPLSGDQGPINPTDTVQYTATIHYFDGSTYDVTEDAVWASSDMAWVTIDDDGLATGVAEGSSAISATFDDGINGLASSSPFTSLLQVIDAGPPPTGITFISSTTFSGTTTGGNLVISKPAGTVSGDMLFFTFTAINIGGTVIGAGDIPAGWDISGAFFSPTANYQSAATLFKVAGGSEPSTYTMPITVSGNVTVIATMYIYRNLNVSTPLGDFNSRWAGDPVSGGSDFPGQPAGTTNATIPAPAVLPDVDDTKIISAFFSRAANGITAPVEMTSKITLTNGSLSITLAETDGVNGTVFSYPVEIEATPSTSTSWLSLGRVLNPV